MNIDGDTGTGGDDENFNNPEERVRRHNIIRLGILLCLFLIWFDVRGSQSERRPSTRTSTSHPSHQHASETRQIPSQYVSNLNEMSRRELMHQENIYNRNITGIFRGDWSSPNHKLQLGIVGSDAALMRSEHSKSAGNNSNKGVAVGGRTGGTGLRTMRPQNSALLHQPSSGKLIIQLKSSEITNIKDITYVYGVARMMGAGISYTDLLYPVKGVYLSNTGELHLLSAFDANDDLYLEIPKVSRKSNSSGITIIPPNKFPDGAFAFPRIGSGTPRPTAAPSSAPAVPPATARRSTANLFGESAISMTNTGRVLTEEDTSTLPHVRHSSLPESIRSLIPVLDYFTSAIETELDIRQGFEFIEKEHPHTVPGRRLAETVEEMEVEWNQFVQDSTTARSLQSILARSSNNSFSVKSFTMGEYPIKLILGKGVTKDESRPVASTDSGIIDESTGKPYFSGDLAAIEQGSTPEAFKNLQTAYTASLRDTKQPFCFLSLSFKTTPAEKRKMTSAESGNPNALMPIENSNIDSKQDKAAQIASGTELIPDSSSSSVSGPGSFVESFDGAVWSPVCGFEFNITATAYHLNVDVLQSKALIYSVIACIICITQIALIILQMRYAQTQAIATKMSILTISGNALVDALICVSHLLLSASIPGLFFQHFMWIAVLKLFLFCVFEMRTIVSIYQARYAQELAAEGWNGLRRRLASLHLRFYAAVFVAMFLALTMSMHPIYLVFLFYSMWVPQIIYNAMNGVRKAFHPAYLYGTGLSRLFIPLYFYGWPQNFISYVSDNKDVPSTATCITLVLWTVFQLAVLFCQDRMGSRFFVPKQWLPNSYNYFRSIPESARRLAAGDKDDEDEEDDIENGGLPECIICYNRIEETYGSYMIAPCDHLFHTQCLRQWMDVKAECPTCRAALPPADDDDDD